MKTVVVSIVGLNYSSTPRPSSQVIRGSVYKGLYIDHDIIALAHDQALFTNEQACLTLPLYIDKAYDKG